MPDAATETIVAESRAMRTIVAAVEKAAAGTGGVVITGELGTGRSLVSRLLHDAGRRPGTHVDVACDALGPADADGALFGRGDVRDKPGGVFEPLSGRFERVWPGSALHRAIDGTLCLRSVEDLPERVQSKLARVFRDGEFAVGSAARPQPHGVRPVAIAGPDFNQHVRDGRVRQDLHKRLSSAAIAVPPLRDRRADIPRLVQLFARRICDGAALPSKTFSPPADTLLRALPWWGNASELQALVSAVVLQCPGDTIDLDAVLAQIRLDEATARTATVSANETLRAARTRFEREYIAAVLAQHRGRIPDAARSLGIQRTNLYRKLRSLRLPKDPAPPGRER